uniref:Uncharacterized protein n=1 Tax=Rhizophora mucronata TaxID=61149 RepID=A0A2P2Q4N9_RHIMU
MILWDGSICLKMWLQKFTDMTIEGNFMRPILFAVYCVR